MNTFFLEIITPTRTAYTDRVDMVTVPGADGVLGILAKHEPLFTRLKDGEVVIKKDNDDIYLAIGGGFMEVTGEKVSILVSRAVHADELNEEEILSARNRAEESIKRAQEQKELSDAHALFQRANLELKLIRRKRTNRPASL